MNKLTKVVNEMIAESVAKCGLKYGFSVEEALEYLKESSATPSRKSVEGFKYPIPYEGEIREECCKGLIVNHGLYTQCVKEVKEEYCVQCDGKNGRIESRSEANWKSPSGKVPKSYLCVLRQMKVSVKEVKESASKYNIKIGEHHFEETAKETKERGRPKNAKKELEVNTTENLFQELVLQQQASNDSNSETTSETGEAMKVKVSKKSKSKKEDIKEDIKEDKDLAKEEEKKEGT